MKKLLGLLFALCLGTAANAVPAAWGNVYGGIAATPTVVDLTTAGAGTYTVPSNYQHTVNGANGWASLLECYSTGQESDGAGDAGAGGGYSSITNANLTPGASIGYFISTSGTGQASSFICNSTSNCATIAGTAVVVGAPCCGTTVGAVGTVKFAGGTACCSAGGGAAGPGGNGGNATGISAPGAGNGGLAGAGGTGGSAGNNYGGGAGDNGVFPLAGGNGICVFSYYASS